MASSKGIYSTRFHLGAAGAYSDYTVPAGFVAVFKCFTCWNGSATVQAASLTLAGFIIWTTNVPAHDGVTQSGLQIVARGGELVRAFLGGTAGAVHSSGYLLAT